ncbi:hypothetical protein R6Z07F_007849 [Ovis aries]
MRRSREDPGPPEPRVGRRDEEGREEEVKRREERRGKEDCEEEAGPALLAPSPPTPSSAPPPTHATHAAGAATPPKPRETAALERTPAPDYPRRGVGGFRGRWVEGRAHTHLVAHGRARRPPSCSRLEVQAAPRQARASIKGFVVPAPPARGPGLGVPQPTAGSRLTEPSHSERERLSLTLEEPFSRCSEWGLLFRAAHWLLIVVASLVVEHRGPAQVPLIRVVPGRGRGQGGAEKLGVGRGLPGKGGASPPGRSGGRRRAGLASQRADERAAPAHSAAARARRWHSCVLASAAGRRVPREPSLSAPRSPHLRPFLTATGQGRAEAARAREQRVEDSRSGR